MRKTDVADLVRLHGSIVHLPQKRLFAAELTAEEVREEKLVKRAGEYELNSVCSLCFPTKRQIRLEHEAKVVK